jgi:hypothetical protein
MIKHIVAFRFRDTVNESERRQLLFDQNEVPKHFPKMKNWTMGRNISKRDDTFTHAFVVEFDSEEGLLEYLNSEEHERFVSERFRPVIEKRAIVTYVVDHDIGLL